MRPVAALSSSPLVSVEELLDSVPEAESSEPDSVAEPDELGETPVPVAVAEEPEPEPEPVLELELPDSEAWEPEPVVVLEPEPEPEPSGVPLPESKKLSVMHWETQSP